MTLKHTPGPWRIVERDDHTEIWDTTELESTVCELPYINGPERANARLIAAAPEMLAALRGIERTAMAANGHGVICQLVLKEARAAIAAVEGRDAD